MLINHLNVRILIGFVFLDKQNGMLAQVSKWLCQGLESKKEEPERGMEAKAGDPRATPVRGGLMHRFLSFEVRMEK